MIIQKKQIRVSKIIYKTIIIFLIFYTFNSYSNIIYDKKNIIISELDLQYYKQLYFQKFEKEINNSKALKNLVIIKKVIKKEQIQILYIKLIIIYLREQRNKK